MNICIKLAHLQELQYAVEGVDKRSMDTPSSPALSPFLPSSEPVYVLSDSWLKVVVLLKKLLRISLEMQDAKKLSDVLRYDLGELIAMFDMKNLFDDISLIDLVNSRSIEEELLLAIEVFWDSLSPREQLIFEHRLAEPNARTLDSLGAELRLTRERVRQLQKLIEGKWGHPELEARWWLRAIAATIRNDLGPVVSKQLLHERLSRAFSDLEYKSYPARIKEVTRHLIKVELAYDCSENVCLDEEASALVLKLKETAKSIADDVGLINPDELRDSLPEEKWFKHWDTLLRGCGLHQIGGFLALRNSKKAQVKAALISIGRPATKKEIGTICGFSSSRLGSQLSVIKSVVRADKKRWGLSEWVEDEYEGIAREIIQRINEDGGATKFERLVDELPRLFGVTESSVWAYVKTPRFLLRDGYVSMADDSTISLLPLLDVVHGHTPDGYPFWRFKVEPRYFEGYSLAGLPAEIVKALGCKPDKKIWVPVSSPAECGPVSVGWPLASVTGSYVGYLAAPLRKLGARSGDHALLVIESGETVSLYLDDQYGGDQLDKDSGHLTSLDRGKDILLRMKNRRRGL
ncbi:MAG: hypothetical protein OXH81_25370 [Gemmatimonadetes bacterium]|nr:hypothetical protein [Gemmatimonadota bacterium]MDE0644037.1 hypothetical protein [bacterium]